MHQSECPCYRSASCPCQCEPTRDLFGYVAIPVQRTSLQQQFAQRLLNYLETIELSQELVITDPYILSCDAEWYKEFLKSILEPLYSRVSKITFITSHQVERSLLAELQNAAARQSCQVRQLYNRFFHDRFWFSIGNRRGIYVGTSLRGIGSKYCYMGIVPNDDAQTTYDAIAPLLLKLNTLPPAPSRHAEACACHESETCLCTCQTRALFGYALDNTDKKPIQAHFITVLHRFLDEILNKEASQEGLIITDPYIFHCHPWQLLWYKGFLKRVLKPLYARVTQITFITSHEYLPELVSEIRSQARSHKCRMYHSTSPLYHDRFWISESNPKGIFVGNSLPNIGAQYCYLGRLPDEDACKAYESLEDIL